MMVLPSVKKLSLTTCTLAFSALAGASGMLPETSVVLINAAAGEGSINVTNTNDHAELLYTSIQNLPEDTEELVLVTSPINRVEAGEKQLVRFVLHTEKPLTTQRFKRVIFEGIAPQSNDGKAKIAISVRQNLPLIINPADLPANNEPWTLLKWEVKGQTLTVRNDSRYVVRLNQRLNLQPTGTPLNLPRTYILPGQSNTLELPADVVLSAESKVRLYPASLYGYQGAAYDAPLLKP